MNPNKIKEITINLPEKFNNVLKKIDEIGSKKIKPKANRDTQTKK